MFLIMLTLLSVLAFIIGFFLGKTAAPKTYFRRKLEIEEPSELQNFLNYNGEIQ